MLKIVEWIKSNSVMDVTICPYWKKCEVWLYSRRFWIKVAEILRKCNTGRPYFIWYVCIYPFLGEIESSFKMK